MIKVIHSLQHSFYIIRRPPDLRLSLRPFQPAGGPSALLGADRRLALGSWWFAYNGRLLVVGAVPMSRLRPRGVAALPLPWRRVYRLPVRRCWVSRTAVRLRVIWWLLIVQSCCHWSAAPISHATFHTCQHWEVTASSPAHITAGLSIIMAPPLWHPHVPTLRGRGLWVLLQPAPRGPCLDFTVRV